MKTLKTIRVLQAIADTHNGTNLKEVLSAQVEYVREALPVLTTRQAAEWILSQPWRSQEEFMPAGHEAVEPILRRIATGEKHPEIEVYEAQAVEDARAKNEGRHPRLITTVAEARRGA